MFDFDIVKNFKRKYFGFLNWEASNTYHDDIGGGETCTVCDSKRNINAGGEDYGDSTEKHIHCPVCGWRGYRLIRYRRSGKCSTLYRKSYLRSFHPISKTILHANRGVIKYDIEDMDSALKVYKYGKKYSLLIVENRNRYSVEKLEDIEIDWNEKTVLFNLECLLMVGDVVTKQRKSLYIEIVFHEAQKILDKTNIYKWHYPSLWLIQSWPFDRFCKFFKLMRHA